MPNHRWPRTGLQIFLMVVLVAGIFLRFVNLDQKVYWHDEAYTSLRISGYTSSEFVTEAFNGQILSVEDVLKFQRPSPEKTLKDVWNSLIEHPEHPPLYYLAARFWVQWFGASVGSIRSLSAGVSLLVFPALYWLCRELFRGTPQMPSSLVSWIAIALVAASPFHILYAQEAREYSLWTVTILLANAALLRAIRRQNPLSWCVYTLSLTLSFYTFLFSALVAIAQGIYVIFNEGLRQSKTILPFFLSSGMAFLLFTPWIIVIWQNFDQLSEKTSWVTVREDLSVLLSQWSLNLSAIFVDIHPSVNLRIALLTLPVWLTLILYAIYLLCQETSPRVWLLIVTLITVGAIAMIFPDLIVGGRRSMMARYFIPSYLGLELAVASAIAWHLQRQDFIDRQIGKFTLCLLISLGLISGAIASQSDTWWNKVVSYNNPQVARIINAIDHPLLISNDHDVNPGNLISLSYLLDSDVQLLLVKAPQIPKPSMKFREIFVFNHSESFLANFKQKNQVNLEYMIGDYYPLWKVQNRHSSQR